MNPFIQRYGINPDDLDVNDPLAMQYRDAWQAKYPPQTER
jgi:hypothetical protein